MLVFIDESGDHNLNYSDNTDPYDVFVLGAVCFNENEYTTFDFNFKKLKKDLFGSENFIIHTAELTRPAKSKDIRNRQMLNPDFRAIFYNKMNELISQTKINVISCAIQKRKLILQKGLDVEDPYLFSFKTILDKIMFHIPKEEKCFIYPEKRTYIEDLKLESEFLLAKATGTKRFKATQIRNSIERFELKDKQSNLSGSQLIDLLVTPVGRNIIGKKLKPAGNEISFEVIQQKISLKDFIIYP